MLIREKFAFYHIPRTGGQSIEHLLQFNKQLEHPGWLRLGQVHAPLHRQPVIVEDYDIFTNIRNPFDRLVSLYELIKAGGVHFIKFDRNVSFPEFIYDHWGQKADKHDEYNTQEEHLFIDGELPENITLIKMEEMNQLWPEVIRYYFGHEGIKIPHKNSVPHADSMTYYNNDLINFVQKREDWVMQFYR